MSTWRLQPVFSNTPRTWVRMVFGEMPPSVAMSSTVLSEARLRATRPSVDVRLLGEISCPVQGSLSGEMCGRDRPMIHRAPASTPWNRCFVKNAHELRLAVGPSLFENVLEV
jgi:hypothetical protein